MAGAAQGVAKAGVPTARGALLSYLFDAFNDGDVESVAAHYHADAELWLTDVYTRPGTAFHGRDGLRTLLQEVFPRLGVSRLEPRDLYEYQDSVLVDLRVHVGGATAPTFVLYTFEDGLIRRVEEFGSREDAVAAATKRGGLLTPRERQVFELLARGRTGPQIAAELFLSPETVRTHVQNGVERLGAKTRVQAVAIALARGEIST